MNIRAEIYKTTMRSPDGFNYTAYPGELWLIRREIVLGRYVRVLLTIDHFPAACAIRSFFAAGGYLLNRRILVD